MLQIESANATRWNSHLNMLRSLLRVPSAIMRQLDFNDKLNAHELKLISDLCDICECGIPISNIHHVHSKFRGATNTYGYVFIHSFSIDHWSVCYINMKIYNKYDACKRM